MNTQDSSSTDLDTAHAFARAYRDIDAAAMRRLLAPTARIRVLMPRGYFEHQGPDALVEELRKFAGNWRTVEVDRVEIEPLAQNLMQTGRLVAIRQRFVLQSTGEPRRATMVLEHLLAITNGRIDLVDELCSGVMPHVG